MTTSTTRAGKAQIPPPGRLLPTDGDQGLPRLELAQIWVPCSLRSAVAAGDHTILLAEVDDVTQVPGPTLAYRDRGYVTAQPLPAAEER